jgi:hypothetical protein
VASSLADDRRVLLGGAAGHQRFHLRSAGGVGRIGVQSFPVPSTTSVSDR